MKHYYFLAGLPRSGSTLLSAILNQNPKIFSSKTSTLIKDLQVEFTKWYKFKDKTEDIFYKHIKNIIDEKYKNIKKPIIFDKSRGWSKSNLIGVMSKILDNPIKIIATVRNVSDCALSFLKIVNPNDIESFLLNSAPIKDLEKSYRNIYSSYLRSKNNILFIDYDDLINDPKKEMKKIHDFLELEYFDYDFNNIDTSIVKEDDEKLYGIPNLHSIKPKLGRQHNDNSKLILGDFYEKFNKECFWKK